MRRYVKLSVIFVITLALFATFVGFTKKPKENKKSQELIARRGHGGGRHGGRRGRGRYGHGGGFRFRFYVGPPRRYYYERPYYRYVRVNCEVFNTRDAKVKEVQIDDRTILMNGGREGSRLSFSLRPGYHTIRWRVSNEKFFGSKYRNFSRSFSVYRDQREMFITIRGSNITIRR